MSSSFFFSSLWQGTDCFLESVENTTRGWRNGLPLCLRGNLA
jgi:hypothetical protein